MMNFLKKTLANIRYDTINTKEQQLIRKAAPLKKSPCSTEPHGSSHHPVLSLAGDVDRVTGQCHQTHAESPAASTVNTAQ